jgi:hypothetical protein
VDLRAALADPRARLGAGTEGLLATAGVVRRDRVGAGEARAFRAANGLPDALYPPAWVVMQLGAERRWDSRPTRRPAWSCPAGNPCGHRGFPGCQAARPPRILKS